MRQVSGDNRGCVRAPCAAERSRRSVHKVVALGARSWDILDKWRGRKVLFLVYKRRESVYFKQECSCIGDRLGCLMKQLTDKGVDQDVCLEKWAEIDGSYIYSGAIDLVA